MNIQAQSLMDFGDKAALLDFMLVHRLVHLQIDDYLVQQGKGSMPNPALDSGDVAEIWYRLMVSPNSLVAENLRPLTDWLELHGNLHQAEYAALNLGQAPELVNVDFRNKEQFYDWMYVHAAVHDTLNQATGFN